MTLFQGKANKRKKELKDELKDMYENGRINTETFIDQVFGAGLRLGVNNIRESYGGKKMMPDVYDPNWKPSGRQTFFAIELTSDGPEIAEYTNSNIDDFADKMAAAGNSFKTKDQARAKAKQVQAIMNAPLNRMSEQSMEDIKESGTYYFVNKFLEVEEKSYDGTHHDDKLANIGNMFAEKENAETMQSFLVYRMNEFIPQRANIKDN